MTRTKRAMSVLAALALALTLAAPAWALGDIDPAAEASIELEMADSAFAQDLAGFAITVLVYKLASVDEHGSFAQEPDFATLGNTEMWSGVFSGNTDMAALADAAQALIFPESAEPGEGADTEDPMYEPEPAIEPLFTVQANPEGASIAIQNAEAHHGLGLYLLLARKTQTTRWVYTFNPVLVTVPAIARDTTPDEGGLPSEGQWQYNVPVGLKAERERRLTEIVIEKTLDEYNTTLGQTTFLFDVEATAAPDGLVFSQLVPLTFSGPGTQSATVSGIPVGAHVTVTEVYSGASYEVSGGSVRVDIPELPLPNPDAYRVPFTNTYTDRQNPDRAVVNRFVYNGSGWVWQGNSEEAG